MGKELDHFDSFRHQDVILTSFPTATDIFSLRTTTYIHRSNMGSSVAAKFPSPEKWVMSGWPGIGGEDRVYDCGQNKLP
jgi:hypothetical protein